MKKVVLVVCLLFVALSFNTFAIDNFALTVKPGITLPVGPRSALFNESELYKLGAVTQIQAQYIIPRASFLYLGGQVNVNIQQTQADILTLLSAGFNTGANIRLGDRLSIQAGGEGGWYLGLFPGLSAASNPYFGGSLNFGVDLTPVVSVNAGGSYKYFLGYDMDTDTYTSLFQGIDITLGAVLHLESIGNRSRLLIDDIRFDPVFPIFYSYYDENPLGNVNITNGENGSINNLRVYFNVNQYMEQPKLCAVVPSMKRGESQTVDLKALFTNNLIYLTESTKVSSEIIVEYEFMGKEFSHNIPYTMRILDRNSMTWDDDRKAASFVTAKDPTVLLFSKNTAGLVRDQGKNPINLNLRIAMGLFETLKLFGINYVIDPKSSYVEASKDTDFVDYLQFASQTLTYRAGDCDDLSILFASLLESVGIETAFITIPGHIFMAFSLDMPEEDARRSFTHVEDLIFHEGKTWIPMEITMISDGFMKAWKMGGREWREATKRDNAGFFPLHEAWQTYEPVGLPGNALALIYPSADDIIGSYNDALNQFVDREIADKIEDYTDRISRRGDSSNIRNRLGVLYVKYGRFEEAQKHFTRALNMDRSFFPAYFNMGNIYFLEDNMNEALKYYEQAQKLKPDSHSVLLSMARVKYALEQYEGVEKDYTRLTEIAPDLAQEYSYLVDTNAAIGRASAASVDAGAIIWEDEE